MEFGHRLKKISLPIKEHLILMRVKNLEPRAISR